MTISERGLRRSKRVVKPVAVSSQYVSEVSEIDIDDEAADEISEYEHESGDENYAASSKKRKLTLSRASKSTKRHARSKLPTTADEVDDFVENTFFQALSTPDISIVELATNWVEEYEFKVSQAIKELLNLILRCCGCVLQVQEHDVSNNDSAAETIEEVQQVFAGQQMHEYPLSTTNAKWKSFKSNVLDFVGQILQVANDKELLCSEESTLAENLLTWLSPLSTSSVRPLRYAATLILLEMQTVLCNMAVRKSGSLERFIHQQDLENKKLDDAKDKEHNARNAKEKGKIAKSKAKILERLEQIGKNVEMTKNEKAFLEEFMDDISNTTFVHRYRDIDPKIRQECMNCLEMWMEAYPEKFFETTYLRYFGWMLSDKEAVVRLEVVKSLLKLYRKSTVAPGFRQFTERFKERLIEMAIYDSDYSIRTTCFSLLSEVTKAGFLEDREVYKISSLVFCDSKSRINLICNTESKYNKSHHELAKIVNVLEDEASKEYIDKHKGIILANATSISLDLDALIHCKTLLEVIERSFEHYLEHYSKLERAATLDANNKYVRLFKFLNVLPSYSNLDLFELALQYLVFDLSSAEMMDSDLRGKLELSTIERQILLYDVASTAFMQLNKEENAPYFQLTKAHAKKKDTGADSATSSEKDVVMNKLFNHFPRLLVNFRNDKNAIRTLIDVFQVLFKVSKLEQGSNRADLLNQFSDRIFAVFKELEIDLDSDEYLMSSFETLLKTMTSNSLEVSDNATRMQISSLLAEITAEVLHDINAEVETPQALCSMKKLSVLSSSLDITHQLELAAAGSDRSEAIISVICSFAEKLSKSEVALYLTIFKVMSSYISWKLENVISNKDQLFKNDSFVFSDTLKHFKTIMVFIRSLALFETKDDLTLQAKLFYIDMITAFTEFKTKVVADLTAMESEDKLADVETFFSTTVTLSIDDELQVSLLQTFLFLESDYAKHLDVQLDRLEDEEVDFVSDDKARAGSGDEDQKLRERIEAENKLCMFTFKLIVLVSENCAPSGILRRLTLNKEALDSILFSKLFETEQDTAQIPGTPQRLGEKKHDESERLAEPSRRESQSSPDMIATIEQEDYSMEL